jgi:hypothetical protein
MKVETGSVWMSSSASKHVRALHNERTVPLLTLLSLETFGDSKSVLSHSLKVSAKFRNHFSANISDSASGCGIDGQIKLAARPK